MKTSIVRILIAASLTAVGTVRLSAQSSIHATVPFDFTVGAKSFAAGEYRVEEVAPAVLAIRSASGHSVTLAQTFNSQATTTPGAYRLTFHRYGNHYFLSAVSVANRGWELPMPTAERELIAGRVPPEKVSVTASTLK